MLDGGSQIRQQGDLTGPFNSGRQFPLMFGTISGNPSRDDLSPFRSKVFQQFCILIIDDHGAVGTKPADLPAGENSFFPSGLPHGLFSFLF